MSALAELPRVPVVPHEEVLAFVDAHHLQCRGLGWIDMHLLAAARLAQLPLWTQDKRLATAARELALGFTTS